MNWDPTIRHCLSLIDAGLTRAEIAWALATSEQFVVNVAHARSSVAAERMVARGAPDFARSARFDDVRYALGRCA